MQMATLEAAVPAGFRFRLQNTALPNARFPRTVGQKIDRKLLQCSAIGQQQAEEVPLTAAKFSEEENALINALIGIQGRGRSASKPQLQVHKRFLSLVLL